jgi:hypothetical protein
VLLSGIKLFSVSSLTEAHDETCLVVCPICPIIDPADLPVNGNVTSVKSGMNGEAEAYPNPVNGMLTIAANGAEPQDVEVHTLAGARIVAVVNKTASGAEIDFSAQPPGIYLVRATVNGERHTWRIVKQ